MVVKELFIDVISRYLGGTLDRNSAAQLKAMEVGFDEIPGGQHDLLKNCEWALRHINEQDYYTCDEELKYYLQCLRGREFTTQMREIE